MQSYFSAATRVHLGLIPESAPYLRSLFKSNAETSSLTGFKTLPISIVQPRLVAIETVFVAFVNALSYGVSGILFAAGKVVQFKFREADDVFCQNYSDSCRSLILVVANVAYAALGGLFGSAIFASYQVEDAKLDDVQETPEDKPEDKSTEVKELETKLTAKEAEFSKYQKETEETCESLRAEISALKQASEDGERDHHMKLEELQDKLATKEKETIEICKNLGANLQALKQALVDSEKGHQAKLEELQSKLTAKEEELSQLSLYQNDVAAIREDLEKKLSSLPIPLEKAEKEPQADAEELRSKLAVKEAELKVLSSAKNVLQDEIEAQRKELESKRQEDVAAIKGKLNEKQEEFSEYHVEVESAFARFRSEINALKQSLEDAEEKREEEVKTLKLQIYKKDEEVKALKQQISDKDVELEEVGSENDKATLTISGEPVIDEKLAHRKEVTKLIAERRREKAENLRRVRELTSEKERLEQDKAELEHSLTKAKQANEALINFAKAKEEQLKEKEKTEAVLIKDAGGAIKMQEKLEKKKNKKSEALSNKEKEVSTLKAEVEELRKQLKVNQAQNNNFKSLITSLSQNSDNGKENVSPNRPVVSRQKSAFLSLRKNTEEQKKTKSSLVNSKSDITKVDLSDTEGEKEPLSQEGY